MKKVMSASDDGYAYVKQRGIYSTYEQKEDGEHSKTIYQTSKGIYNTKDKSLYGNTTQEITSEVDNKIIKKKLIIVQILVMRMDRYKVRIQVWMFHT